MKYLIGLLLILVPIITSAQSSTQNVLNWDRYSITAPEGFAVGKGISNKNDSNAYPPSGVYFQVGPDTGNKAMLPPRILHPDSIANPLIGMIAFSYSDSSLKVYNGLDWIALDSSGGGGAIPSGNTRQILTWDSSGNPIADYFSWELWSDTPYSAPPFQIGLAAGVWNPLDTTEWIQSFIPVSVIGGQPNHVPFYDPVSGHPDLAALNVDRLITDAGDPYLENIDDTIRLGNSAAKAIYFDNFNKGGISHTKTLAVDTSTGQVSLSDIPSGVDSATVNAIVSDSIENKSDSTAIRGANLFDFYKGDSVLRGSFPLGTSVPPDIFDPKKLSNWFDASDIIANDSASLSAWRDKTGTTTTTTSAPIFRKAGKNNLPTVYFQGVNQSLEFNGRPIRQFLMVLNSTDGAMFDNFDGLLSESTFSTFGVAGTQTSVNLVRFPATGVVQIAGWSNLSFAPLSEYKIVSVQFTSAVAANNFSIGSFGKQGGRFWRGNISEVITLNDTLTAAEHQRLYNYLSDKYSLNRTNLQVYDGNSLMVGTAITPPQSIGARVNYYIDSAFRNTRTRYLNVAQGGATIGVRIGAAKSAVDANFNNLFSKQWVFMYEGTNSLGPGQGNAVYNQFMLYANQRIARDSSVVVFLISCFDATQTKLDSNARRVFNSLLASTPETKNLKIINITDPHLDGYLACGDTTYYLPDSVHLNPFGSDYASKLIFNQVYRKMSPATYVPEGEFLTYTDPVDELIPADNSVVIITLTDDASIILPDNPPVKSRALIKVFGSANVLTVTPSDSGTIDEDPNIMMTPKEGKVLLHIGSNNWINLNQ